MSMCVLVDEREQKAVEIDEVGLVQLGSSTTLERQQGASTKSSSRPPEELS